MNEASTPVLRKTRIVCISDTHNQTPKLPKGDVLIHAGDLTKQGSFSELKKTVGWLEKADFEAKIVIAGNHELTLDAPFYERNHSRWKWPEPQNLEECRKLLLSSPTITYLEHQPASIYLGSPNGPHTCFKVFGSPYSPNNRKWAFAYEPGSEEASKLWDAIPLDVDIVITHTPPKGHCDAETKDDRSGCEVLLQALHRVRPMLSVFGHIHEARGVEIVRWNLDAPGNCCPSEIVEVWKDPGIGTNKQSLVNVSAKGGRRLDYCGALQHKDFSLMPDALQPGVQSAGNGGPQPDALKSTSAPQGVAGSGAEEKAMQANTNNSNSVSKFCQAAPQSDIGQHPAVPDAVRGEARYETVMMNAAFLGPRINGRTTHFNKPIVVDIDLPVWTR